MTLSYHPPAAEMSLAPLIEDAKILITVGSGGVGKTTTAAALALYASHIGKRTLVITIDPAHRLANALGLLELSYTPQRLTEEVLKDASIACSAPLSAMMLDLKAAWDDLVRRSTGNPEKWEKILGNPIYNHVSQHLPGAQEFIACETLYNLYDSGDYDLIILDTPPTSNALDFLDAPQRILDLLDHDGFNLFLENDRSRTRRIGFRFLDAAGSTAQQILAKLTGTQFLQDFADFLILFREVYPLVRQRTREFLHLLEQPIARFLLVTSPATEALRETELFHNQLQLRKHHIGALICNRVHAPPQSGWAADLSHGLESMALKHNTTNAQIRFLKETTTLLCEEQSQTARAEQAAVLDFRSRMNSEALNIVVPRMRVDVHDVQSLCLLLPWLTGISD
jgi:anion-transporting  ArsA/GET3 family ATPase